MSQIIIYPNEGKLAVVFPNPACGLTIEQIAGKDVPQGIPYLIMSVDQLPEDQTLFDAWEADFSEPDGFGDPDAYWAAQAAESEVAEEQV